MAAAAGLLASVVAVWIRKMIDAEYHMVPQALADAFKDSKVGYVEFIGCLSRTHTRDHEQLRGLKGAGGDNHFFSGLQRKMQRRNTISTGRGDGDPRRDVAATEEDPL